MPQDEEEISKNPVNVSQKISGHEEKG